MLLFRGLARLIAVRIEPLQRASPARRSTATGTDDRA
jgi:hypothetical protein